MIEKNIEKKKIIVDAIVNLIDQHGLKKVSVKKICEKAGVSLGTFYNHFSSKYEVVTHMYEVMDSYLLGEKERMMSHTTAEEDILSFASSFGQFVQEWGYYANILIMTSSIEDIREKTVRNRCLENILIEIIENGIDKKAFVCPLPVADYMSSLFAIIRGSLLEWAKGEIDFPIQKKIEQRISIYLHL